VGLDEKTILQEVHHLEGQTTWQRDTDSRWLQSQRIEKAALNLAIASRNKT
jgi:hypothetical protein